MAFKGTDDGNGNEEKETEMRRHDEDTIQMSCVTWFRYTYPQYRRLLHHSPNGGRRDAREGARFKAMGVQAGFPDLILLVPANGYHGLFIELKTETGRQQATQKEYQQLVEAEGYCYKVVRSRDGFIETIKEYLEEI